MIRIRGHSDDIVEVEGDGPHAHLTEEYGSFDKAVSLEVTAPTVTGGIRVVARYAQGAHAVWRLGVEPLDEDLPMPWPVTVCQQSEGYSLTLAIDAPSDAEIKATKIRGKRP